MDGTLIQASIMISSYKLVKTGLIISKFHDVYSLKPISGKSTTKDVHITAINTLLTISLHFYSLLFNEDPISSGSSISKSTEGESTALILASWKKNLSPKKIYWIILQGYNILSIQLLEWLNLNLWKFITSAKNELICLFFDLLNLEILKCAQLPASTV